AITTSVDPNAHVGESFGDTLGRTIYTQAFSGLYGGTLTASEQTTAQYTILGEPTQVKKTDLAPQVGQTITSVTATASYDDLGQVTQESDPDSGSHTYTYDANGQVLTDVSSTRTLGYNYDLLGRLGCLQDAAPTINAKGTCTSGTNPYEQYTYDISAPGAQWGSTDYPIGQLTQSIATTYYSGSAATSTENTQYDQRGQAITQQLKLSLPSSWNVATALPTYQLASSYDDANQLTTVATSTVASNGNSTPGYTMTQVYDQTNGMLVGLGTTNSQTANLASVLYNENALVSTINFVTNTGNAMVASEQFSYDGDLRPIETNATWQSGSGTSGTILDQQRSYDPASNVTSLATTLAGVPGKSGSGGSETENFCYNAQDKLVWAGNSGTQPTPGNGTCGTGTLSSNLSGAAYNNSYVYTHLGQLWQGPLNGGNTQYQYLYCNTGTPHQLTGMYPLGTTCANLSGAVYKTSYDSWGNATSRTYNGSTTTQTFDLLDQLVKWANGTTQKQWYAYNTSGERTVLRSTNGSATTMTVYAFGAEEYTYDGSGNLQSSTHYYDMGGRLIGELTGGGTPSTDLFLTDALGSVLTTFSNVQNSAAVQGNQTYGPYGTGQYSQGSMGTNKGYTGQYADPLSGFDYYNARYYDPVCGTFLSADPVEGNMQGLNPYAYVDGNPETYNDPTGNMYAPPGGGGGGGNGGGGGTPPPSCQGLCWIQQQWNNVRSYAQQQWSDFTAHPVEYLQQQLPAQVTKVGISVRHIVAVAIFAVGIGIGVALWRFASSGPRGDVGWLRPIWSDLEANENVPHQRAVSGGKIINSSQHVLKEHVYRNNNDLQKRALKIHGDVSAFYDVETAQWTVDYALQNMNTQEVKQLASMKANPMAGKQLVLTGTMPVDIGHGFKYNDATGTTTYIAATRTYLIRIAVDVNTGEPYIITAYPTL
ncbi:MAG TPA: RHS repeat-associated core domain-containing protein, partial [Ktedonobacteraceae bacterium]|nr:RHS repeat-associated core domain-containing protein [Ktedonobacteraceae bacterium]